MNCLHNYVVNDTPSFLSQPDRLETVFEMCKHVSAFDRLSQENPSFRTIVTYRLREILTCFSLS